MTCQLSHWVTSLILAVKDASLKGFHIKISTFLYLFEVGLHLSSHNNYEDTKLVVTIRW